MPTDPVDGEALEPAEALDVIQTQARRFLDALRRMTPDERKLVTKTLELGCVVELPENVHVDIDLLRRYLGWTRSKILRLLGKVGSLGFSSYTRFDEDHGELGGPSEMVVLSWHLLLDGPAGGSATLVAHEMVLLAKDGYCEDCGEAALERLDFSQLATATETHDTHAVAVTT